MSFCQIINRLRSFPIYCSTARRFVHNQHNAKVLVPLTHRKLLKVSGKDAPNFLQGLITNDMRHFEDNAAKSIYAMFLNNKGRVMFDTLIYKWDNNDTFLVECDEKCMASLKNHLKLFKLKQAVNIEDMDKHLHLWALMSLVDSLPTFKTDMNSPISILKDPRLVELGCRILTVPTMEVSDILKVVAIDNVKLGDEKVYKYLRYKLGVGEGPEELPPGLCFPLEVNCDYLHGVSFHKGCYIGQELTARVHHTGVVRKRLMPIKFNNVLTNSVEKDTVIKSANNPKSNLGKLKAFMLDYGLGLVRIKEALEAKQLVVEETTGKVLKPTWWPLEAPKEKIAPRTD